ncbi:ribosomal-protein-alanine N-acetyltransferase [candidate division NPL-UPA2 bacterium Unc8]|uniref:[Ribosomal protein bS18]-alanine N-acetyltransferase n=1 Tax=candidate division NPL-UPA2 bacterium Unc8 TaxID=1980939 RepID=A0A399FZF9_UNCN2|nr:N-alpha-acetyltransferase RimI [Bacillota bacterium]MBT9139066.1 N-alpha-acetyltransferase RimI [Bacillota bacterium]MBT9146356.1 N-alpha-acetyltransferase RimI [Bacillota bacterium]RII00652.1 MAG: ribosomal-protein-alanine N-acetyltransferase [candidate division NPL-UPA2 bacterium Unc8]
MTEKDVGEALAIERDVFPSPWTRGMFLQELSNEDSYFIVVREKEKLIGYGGFFMIGEVARLENLAVHPDFRRRGVATKLLRELLATVKANGGDETTLEVRSGNQEAQNLYRKFGFLISGKRPEFYGDNREDALIMSKKIVERVAKD